MEENKNNTPADQQSAKGPSDQEPTFWTESRVRLLAGSIIIMSFLLMLGFGLVIYKVIEKSLTSNAHLSPSNTKPIPTLKAANARKRLEVNLEGYKVKEVSSNGRLITLEVEKAGQMQIWVIDSSEKTIKSIIDVKQ